MTTPTPPSDTDRIIAAHREEARKTRVLLAWIFIGIPLIGGALWGIIAVGARTHSDNSGTPPRSGSISIITDDMKCSDVSLGATDGAIDAYTGNNSNIRASFNLQCDTHPDETAGEVLANVKIFAPTN